MSHKKNQPIESKPLHPDHPKIIVHEFLVDFLGALVPGILFTLAIAIALTPLIRAIVALFSPPSETPPSIVPIRQFLQSSQNTPSAIWIGLFVFGILFSYTIGHLFYRRDPKKPDVRSFNLLSKELIQKTNMDEEFDVNEEEFSKINKCSRKAHLLRCNFGCDNEKHCEFPYPYLDKYLEARGHHHLVKLIPWAQDVKTGSSTGGRTGRSKTYINRLKIRLETSYPEACRSIIRNEAHVRLATSMWYVGRFLWKCNLVAIAFFGMVLLIFHSLGLFPPNGRETMWCLSWCIPVILPALIVCAFARYCQRAIERFILYQRLREAFYVLEVAYTCFRDQPQKLSSPEINI